MYHPATMRVLGTDNPFEAPPELDYFRGPRTDPPLWNETWFFSAWSPENGVGIFIHAGTDGADPELFYNQIVVYLPDGQLAVDRMWGRPKAGDLTFGSSSVSTTEPFKRWRVCYDGACEITTSDECGTKPVGAGLAVPVSFDIELKAAGPVWDLYKASGLEYINWAGLDLPEPGIHHEQITRSEGSIRVGDRTWTVDGYGFRDHSTGPRDFADTRGDRFWGFMSPTTGRGFQGIKTWGRKGDLQLCSAGYLVDDTLEIINGGIEMTGIEDTQGNPKDLECSFTRPNGEHIVAPGKILHTVTISCEDPNNWVNGALREGDPLILSESAVHFDWPDGDVFYGHLERIDRAVHLRWPTD